MHVIPVFVQLMLFAGGSGKSLPSSELGWIQGESEEFEMFEQAAERKAGARADMCSLSSDFHFAFVFSTVDFLRHCQVGSGFIFESPVWSPHFCRCREVDRKNCTRQGLPM